MNLAADLALRSSVVLAAGLLLGVLFRRRSAALRHSVLAAGIFGSVVVMPLRIAGPAMPLSLPSAASFSAPAHGAQAVRVDATNAVDAFPGNPAKRWMSPWMIWFVGFGWTAGLLVAGVVRYRRVARRAERAADGRWTEIAREIAASRRITQRFELLQTDTADVLATTGVVRHRILLPVHARDWPEARLRAVLSHELAHIQRCDWLIQITTEIIRTLLWFNPLVWIACTRLRREAEQACDDIVLAEGVSARDYAEHLLALARLCRRPGSRWAPAVPMAHPSTLERRITAMLNPRLDRTAVSRRVFATFAALLAVVTMTVAAVRGAQGPATLSGSVYDTTGAVLPGVELTLEGTNEAKWTATSNAAGRFDFPGVAAGRYVLSVSLRGFRALRQEFELRNARDWDRAITLQIGDVMETITVSESRVPPAPSPSQPQFGTPIRVGGNIRVPVKIRDVRPAYPATMRAAGREGVVPIEAIIGKDGTVSSVRVLSAEIHPDFAIAAVDAVRQWRFRPTLLNGVPVEVVMTVSVAFNLSD